LGLSRFSICVQILQKAELQILNRFSISNAESGFNKILNVNIAEQKLRLAKDVLSITDKKLLFQLEHFIKAHEHKVDFWEGLPEEIKNEIEQAKVESKEKKGKEHKSVMKSYSKWL
jgi:hypothetical protein